MSHHYQPAPKEKILNFGNCTKEPALKPPFTFVVNGFYGPCGFTGNHHHGIDFCRLGYESLSMAYMAHAGLGYRYGISFLPVLMYFLKATLLNRNIKIKNQQQNK